MTGRVLPNSATWTVVLTIGFALLTAAAAQVRIPLPFTPVPITGQTFAVLLTGAALGATWGGASQLVYVLMGASGLPFFAGAEGGLTYVTGATGGYLLGFVLAAIAVGYLAEHQQDRTVAAAIPAFLTGNLIIYAVGVPWLYRSVESITTGEAALAAGFTPFIAGDLVKVALAGLLLPAAWKMARKY
ncbi:MAG: biotin transporter BioY [bacterium]|nr:biotin transporter BioY [bacterium]MCP5118359.1 biotin transporter BioY [bacterium]